MKIIINLKQHMKMNLLESPNLYINDDEKYWSYIHQINWYKIAKNQDHILAQNNMIQTLLNLNLELEEMHDFYNWIVTKRENLLMFIKGYLKGVPTIEKDIYLSDDTLWDLAAHIVGLGEAMYQYTMRDPSIIKLVYNDVLENFEYPFLAAIEAMQDDTIIVKNC